jgi:eukaryotic-like serine/threonine-protein kinase
VNQTPSRIRKTAETVGANAESPFLSGRNRFGRWLVGRRIARGAWSDVFQGFPANPLGAGQADYVIKVAVRHPRRRRLSEQMLQREALAAQQVVHRRIVSVLDADFEHDPIYLVQPKISGWNLQRFVAVQDSIYLLDKIWWLRQVAQGLHALHQQGIVHGDLTTRNIMIDSQGAVTLIDLGVASRVESPVEKVADVEPSKLTIPPLRLFVGTPRYASPECFANRQSLTFASDIFSLGVIAFELLTGSPPFDGASTDALVRNVQSQTAPSILKNFAGCPRELGTLIDQSLAKTPSHRPTAMELVNGLLSEELQQLRVNGAA